MQALKTGIQYLKGVGPKLARLFERKGIFTVEDLLFFIPRDYQDRRNISKISELTEGDFAYFKAKIISVQSNKFSRVLTMTVSDGTGVLYCKWFHFKISYFKEFTEGKTVLLSGPVKAYRGHLELHHPDIKLSQEQEELKKEIVPIYSDIKGMSQTRVRKIILTAINSYINEIEEFIADDTLHRLNIANIRDSIYYLHIPKLDADIGELRDAGTVWHKRLIFGELFKLELLLIYRRQTVKRLSGIQHNLPKEQLESLKLPFELTGDQKKALSDILKDMASPYVMNRLIQGDVGSGKTILAFYSAIVSILNGFQVVMMAPTEILAKQHFDNFIALFNEQYNVALLTGSVSTKEKKLIKAQVQSGEISFLIGTHAVIQKDVIFENLGLAIVDEQHRFGVRERLKLLNHGSPDVLVLTATPIPRSLAMTIYGDLDISVIREKPKGRQKIITRLTEGKKRSVVYTFIKEKLDLGYQAYFVYPLIEESDVLEYKAAKEALDDIKQQFTDYEVALLHGKMRQEEKDFVMKEFRDKKIDILLATTVIEVGIDIPNANIMLIENPERFGLSQLHQLRGRIGRGTQKAYCIMILDKGVSRQAYERLKIFESTDDGFKIAEADLELRGPGEFLGTRQHGLPGFRFANIVRDMEELILARKEAERIISVDPNLSKPAHYKLRRAVLESKEAEYINAV